MAELLGFSDGFTIHTLRLAADTVGKRLPFPLHLERPTSEVRDLDVVYCSGLTSVGTS
jgi:hypothetical protein